MKDLFFRRIRCPFFAAFLMTLELAGEGCAWIAIGLLSLSNLCRV